MITRSRAKAAKGLGRAIRLLPVAGRPAAREQPQRGLNLGPRRVPLQVPLQVLLPQRPAVPLRRPPLSPPGRRRVRRLWCPGPRQPQVMRLALRPVHQMGLALEVTPWTVPGPPRRRDHLTRVWLIRSGVAIKVPLPALVAIPPVPGERTVVLGGIEHRRRPLKLMGRPAVGRAEPTVRVVPHRAATMVRHRKVRHPKAAD